VRACDGLLEIFQGAGRLSLPALHTLLNAGNDRFSRPSAVEPVLHRVG
jgi:hypothetical protein